EAVVTGAEVRANVQRGPGVDRAAGEQGDVVNVLAPVAPGDVHVHRRAPEAGGAGDVGEVAEVDPVGEREVGVPLAEGDGDVHRRVPDAGRLPGVAEGDRVAVGRRIGRGLAAADAPDVDAQPRLGDVVEVEVDKVVAVVPDHAHAHIGVAEDVGRFVVRLGGV